jgi:hypothetical protein
MPDWHELSRDDLSTKAIFLQAGMEEPRSRYRMDCRVAGGSWRYILNAHPDNISDANLSNKASQHAPATLLIAKLNPKCFYLRTPKQYCPIAYMPNSFWDHPIETIEKALSIRKQIEALQETLNKIYGGKAPAVTGTAAVVRRGRGRPRKTAVVATPSAKVDGRKAPRSAATRAKMAAAAKARWAAKKGVAKASAKSAAPATTAASSNGRKKKRTMSPEGRARIAAAQRARWAKLKG